MMGDSAGRADAIHANTIISTCEDVNVAVAMSAKEDLSGVSNAQ